MAKKSKSKKSKFKGGVARNAAKQTRGTQFGHLNLPKGVSVFKEDPGSRVNIDILPYEVTCSNHPDRDDEYEIAIPGSLWYKRPYWLHRNIGADSQSIVCPSSIGEKCPICEYRAQLIKDGTEWNDDSVRALKASMRNLYMVIPKGNKKYDEEPHIWDISQYLFQDKLNEEIGENEDYETFPDLEEGLTLRIRFSEESFGSNKFAETSRIDFKKRNEPYDEAILEGLPSLDDLLEIPSYKAIDAMFFGGLSQEEVEVEEEEEETSRSRRSRRRTVEPEEPEEEPEEEEESEEEEEESEEEEEEEKKPTRKRNSKSEKAGKEDKKSSKGKKSKCPHGHKFGDDCEEYDECDECEMWEKCMDASEER